MPKQTRVYEVTSFDTGHTGYYTEAKCIEMFGRDEWPEYLAGYLPNILVVEVDEHTVGERQGVIRDVGPEAPDPYPGSEYLTRFND
jgi:hypothetical protein